MKTDREISDRIVKRGNSMSLWCGWVFDTVTTRRWCLVEGDSVDEAMTALGVGAETSTSTGKVVWSERALSTVSKLGSKEYTHSLENPPKWVEGSAGEIYDEARLEQIRKIDAERAALRKREEE